MDDRVDDSTAKFVREYLAKCPKYEVGPEAPLSTWRADVGVGKSQRFRAAAVRFLSRTKHEGCVVIAIDHHALSDEQLKKFHEEHPNTQFVVAVWRGRNAYDPQQPDPSDPTGKARLLMCLRAADAEEVGKHGFSVENCLCRYVDRETDEEIVCPHYDEDAPMPCGYQRQQRQHASVWLCAHETLVHQMPDVFGKVLMLYIDEDPLDAFLFGLDENEMKQFIMPLDALKKVPHTIKDEDDRKSLANGRRKLHRILAKLPLGPVPVNVLRDFFKEETDTLQRLEWEAKITDIDIRPDMDSQTIAERLAPAANNKRIRQLATLWKLVGEAVHSHVIVGGVHHSGLSAGDYAAYDTISGRMEIIRASDGERFIRMKGVREINSGCSNIPTMIGSATIEHQLLLPIWPTAKEYPPLINRKPEAVTVKQVVDRSFSKKWITSEDDINGERARDVFAVIVREAMTFAPRRSLMIVHKATEAVIRGTCHVPDWIKIAHWGAIIGIDKWRDVRAAFIVGRPMPSASDVTGIAEALFGVHIPQREYVARKVEIAIVPNADGHNVVEVEQFQHPHPMGELLRKRVSDGGVAQAAGRTRWAERTEETPLELWLLCGDVLPPPELAPVVAVEAADIAPSLDDLMWTKGVWLENAADAARAFPELIASGGALRESRSSRGVSETPVIRLLTGKTDTPPQTTHTTISYRRAAKGAKKARAVFLAGAVDDPEQWLKDKLGPLAFCD